MDDITPVLLIILFLCFSLLLQFVCQCHHLVKIFCLHVSEKDIALKMISGMNVGTSPYPLLNFRVENVSPAHPLEVDHQLEAAGVGEQIYGDYLHGKERIT